MTMPILGALVQRANGHHTAGSAAAWPRRP